MRTALLCLLTSLAMAMQLQERELLSPIVNRSFQAKVVPRTALTFDETKAASPADMKTDLDGCRHNAGISEYHHFIVTDPYTYFSALAEEWDPRSPRFRHHLDPEFKTWLTSKDGFHSEWVIERNQFYRREQAAARRSGRELPPLKQWVIPQAIIPVEKKYKLALRCYEKRQARAALMAKIALSGAWALRIDFNRPLFDADLSGAIGEVNDRIRRQLPSDKELAAAGDDFDPDQWRQLYGKVFRQGGLSNEALYVAGSSYLGFVLRDGNLEEARAVLDRLDERLKNVEGTIGIKLRSLVRDRSLMMEDYLLFLRGSVRYHVQAIQGEEITRSRLLTTVLAVAESLRRSGQYLEAWDWYYALANMSETQHSLRDHIRAQGGVPDLSAGMDVQLGWMADQMMTRLAQDHDVIAGEKPTSQYAGLINAIVHGGLGTPEFRSPSWQARTGADATQAQAQLDRLGKTLLDYQLRRGAWPAQLTDLWSEGVIQNWNAVNRFHCPATGAPYDYRPPENATIGDRVVLISMSQAVRTNQGLRYGAYLMDNTLIWTTEQLQPGQTPGP